MTSKDWLLYTVALLVATRTVFLAFALLTHRLSASEGIALKMTMVGAVAIAAMIFIATPMFGNKT